MHRGVGRSELIESAKESRRVREGWAVERLGRDVVCTGVDSLYFTIAGHLHSTALTALGEAKRRSKDGDKTLRVASGDWRFAVLPYGAGGKGFGFEFVLVSPWATIKINPKGGDTLAYVELRARALWSLGASSLADEVLCMVSRWSDSQPGQKLPATVSNLHLAVDVQPHLLGLGGPGLGRAFVTRGRSRIVRAVAERQSRPVEDVPEAVKKAMIDAIGAAEDFGDLRRELLRLTESEDAEIRTTFHGVEEHHGRDAVFARGRRVTGYSFGQGGDFSAAIYNKSEEARVKPRSAWWLDFHNRAASSPLIGDVWRVELRVRGAGLSELASGRTSLKTRRLPDVLNALPGIWEYMVGGPNHHGWITHRTPTGDRPTLWPLSLGWRVLQGCRWTKAGDPWDWAESLPDPGANVERFSRKRIPAALRTAEFRRAEPIRMAASAMVRGSLADGARRNADQIRKQAVGVLEALVASEVAAGDRAEPETEAELQSAMSDIAKELGQDTALGAVTEKIDTLHFRGAHALLDGASG